MTTGSGKFAAQSNLLENIQRYFFFLNGKGDYVSLENYTLVCSEEVKKKQEYAVTNESTIHLASYISLDYFPYIFVTMFVFCPYYFNHTVVGEKGVIFSENLASYLALAYNRSYKEFD